MWVKVTWLFIWTTLAFWVGCSAAPQGPRLTQDRPQEGRGGTVALAVQIDDTELGLPETPYITADEDAVQTPLAEDAPGSLQGLDRSNWSTQLVFPQRGRVAHWPVYYSRDIGGTTWRYTEDRGSVLDRGGNIEASADAIFDAESHHFGGGQFADAAIGPFNFALDTILLPYRMVRTPPWQLQLSGSGDVVEAYELDE